MSNEKKKILIVEDDVFLRELISRKLVSEGYDIKQASDGEDGLRELKNEAPDLILLDLILPGIDGFEVLMRMKKDSELAHIPIIILSNYISPEENEEALKLGALFSLAKPHFMPSEILEIIEEVLEERE